MTKSGLFGAAAMLAALIATPAMAQQAFQEPGAYAQNHPWANDYNPRYGRSGFWPSDVAADVVGGGSDSYAYYGGRGPRYDDSHAYYGDRPARTTCGLQPGSTYRGPDGRWYPC